LQPGQGRVQALRCPLTLVIHVLYQRADTCQPDGCWLGLTQISHMHTICCRHVDGLLQTAYSKIIKPINKHCMQYEGGAARSCSKCRKVQDESKQHRSVSCVQTHPQLESIKPLHVSVRESHQSPVCRAIDTSNVAWLIQGRIEVDHGSHSPAILCLSAALCTDCKLPVPFWQTFVCVIRIIGVTADSIDLDVVFDFTPLTHREH